MNFSKKQKLVLLIIILGCIFLSSNIIKVSILKPYSNKDSINEDPELIPPDDIKKINAIDPKTEVIESIYNRAGNIFCNISTTNKDLYINRYQPGLNIQPNLFLQNWNLTHAKMTFENITALNYTKNIETEPTEFITSYSETEPIYVYQKFAVETDQYVNNVSIFIQDVIDEDHYSDENSWEVSIVNCSDDPLGIPNSNETLGTVIKPHPIDVVAHWEVFDFKNSEIGPIFLNTSKTNWTEVNGIMKYWFAFKVKIPPNDWRTGGGPKFLYLNPDGSDPDNIGEGETFAQSPQFINLFYFYEEVIENKTVIGNYIDGNISSFTTFDEDRFLVNSTWVGGRQTIQLAVRFEIDNLTSTEYTWADLKSIRYTEPLEWKNILNSIVFSMNFSLVTNINKESLVNDAKMRLYNPYTSKYDKIDSSLIDIQHEEEFLQYYVAIEPEEKLFFIQHMNTSANGNNSLIFIFDYEGIDAVQIYNISINLFNIEIGEIETIKTIQKYDPIVHDLHYSNNVTSLNSTFNTPPNEIIKSLEENDDKFLEVVGDSGSNTTIIDFKFNILTDFNSSLWDVDDPIDWIFKLPNPRIFQIDFHISSNVSIEDPLNLTYAALEIYNGGDFAPFNDTEWIRFSDDKTFADINETTKILPFDSFYSWYIMHLINESDNNSLKVRLRFIGNNSFSRINVSIDEFILNFHIQNVISSDITSKIGFGLNSDTLKSSYIHLKNFGVPVFDNGLWEKDISEGIPIQGFFYFNVTSIWPEIVFDVSGFYTIEKSQNYNWEYKLDDNQQKVLWNVSSDISYYDYYTNVQYSQGLKFNIPSDWSLMEIYNCSILPPNPSGGWYSTTQSLENYKIITVNNISDGIWKIGMNSSKTPLLFAINSTDTYIDKVINVDIEIQNEYGGAIHFEIYNSDSDIIYSEIKTLNETSFENSVSYNWDIFSTTKLPGTYHLKASWILYNETHVFLALNTTEIMVSKYNVNLEILNIEDLSKTFIYGSDILIQGRITNNETGTVIEGEPIIAEFYDNTFNLIDTKSDVSNNEGIIQMEYTLPTGYSKLSVKLVYNASGTYYSTGQSIQTLEIELISQTEYNLNIFFKFLPYIGAILGIFITTIVAIKYRKSKMRKLWAGDAKVLDDLVKISHIMIIHKEVGVSIYNKQISLEDIDPDLISGFLQAISQFRSEIKKDTDSAEGKGFEMDYGDFKIVINDGNFIRMALILDGIPSEKLKENQELFIEDFERKFDMILKDFTGDITELRDADDLIEKHFNISLIYPLQLAKHYGVIKIKGLEKALVEVADQILKEKKFFFISSLLNFVLAGRKASRDEIISVIIDLKRKGVIIPATIE